MDIDQHGVLLGWLAGRWHRFLCQGFEYYLNINKKIVHMICAHPPASEWLAHISRSIEPGEQQ
ncbi:hypothetical protein [Pseudomonas aeruginosa]|uniref:hypothetical protein n=1 Tax=Pseudomonas aeruginosa TaxID=287 RepID=UPI003979B8D4